MPDILSILKNDGPSLSSEELSSYHEILQSGSYDKKTVQACEELLCALEQERRLSREKEKKPLEKKSSDSERVNADAPKSAEPLDYAKIVADYFKKNRNRPDYKSHFRKYIAESNFFREDFIGQNISLFNAEELEIIVSVIQLSEPFLEKFFKSFDPEKISRYQEFSEEFFIKHINELKIDVVLKEGRNPWRRKEVMSKKLSGMLRLKGVRL